MNELDINIGAQVHCWDGVIGKLAKVVVDPEQFRVTNLIVEEGILTKHARVFPISLVETAGAENIYLSTRSEDLDSFPVYQEKEFIRPADGWEHPDYQIDYVMFPGHSVTYSSAAPKVKEKVRQGIPPGFEVMKQGTPIKNAGGTIGKLDQVVTDAATNDIRYLVMQRGLIFTSRVDIPVYLVKTVDEDGIRVDITEEELERLAYQPEEDR
jgi:sporulation protein YlmC with PRC-barrel domain